jgi:hypothetical protein
MNKLRMLEDDGVKQIQLGNNTGITWVPGVRAVKLRTGRYWLKILAGQQNIKFYWGANPCKPLTE